MNRRQRVYGPLTDDELTQSIEVRRNNNFAHIPNAIEVWKDLIAEQRLRHVKRFKAEHDLTDADFATDHWQALFAIQYPEARP